MLALLVAALGGTSFQRQVDSFQPLGFETIAHQGSWLVLEAERRTNLLEGDQILLVRGDTVGSRLELVEKLQQQDQTSLVIQRDEGLVDVSYLRPPLDVDVAYLILSALGVFYLLIGLYTALKNDRAPSRIFFFWCLTSSALYLLSPVLPVQDMTDKWIFLVDQLARTLLPALTLHLCLLFPEPFLAGTAKRLKRRLAVAGVYLPAALLLTFHLDQALAGGRLFSTASESTYLFVDRLELFLLVLYATLAVLALFIRLARSSPDWEVRRQVQWVGLGLLGGYLPFLLIYVIPSFFGVRLTWTEIAGVVPLCLVPLGFAYAILKYKLWDIAVIVRDTIAYSLTVLVGLCGFALIHLLIERIAVTEMTVARNFLTFAAGLVVAGALVPTKTAITRGLESWQYRHTLPQRQALGQLGSELLYERDLTRLCITLIDRLADGLMAHANLYLVRGGGRLSPVVPENGVPDEIGSDDLGSELWHRDVASLEPTHLPETRTSVDEHLFEAGYRYAFPLLVRDHRVGILLVSYKFDGEPLNSEDLELSRGLLNQASLAIENAHLLEEVHRRLKEVGRLEEHNKGIIESSPVGIAVLDGDDRVVSANTAFAVLVESPSKDFIGRAFEDILPVRPLPRSGQGLVEVSYAELSGRERYLQLAVAPHESADGEPLRIVIVQDTSELHAIQLQLKEKERLASLGLLAAGVAHEVNTPLTGISSYAQLLLAGIDENHPHFEILRKLERQTFRAAQIVNNLLEFSRNRHDDLTPINLVSLLNECLNMLSERLRDEGVEIERRLPAASEAGGSASVQVLGHEGELHQVFNNLLVNALDAMGAGGGRISLEIEMGDERVRVRISDTGPGVPPERLERIFQPFFSSKLGKGGTGLGLAISYNIVRRHRGEIRAENLPDGEGCRLTVELPRHISN